MVADPITPPIDGLILAGGLSRRMGQEKSLLPLAGKRLIDHAIACMVPQCQGLLVNANGDAGRFALGDMPIVADLTPDFAGPLAGIAAGLAWVRQHRPAIRWLVSCPTDAPFLPHDLVARLFAATQQEAADMAMAASYGQAHPVAALWPLDWAEPLAAAVAAGLRKVDRWTGQYRCAMVDFTPDASRPDQAIDPFFNINTREDLDQAASYLAQEARK